MRVISATSAKHGHDASVNDPLAEALAALEVPAMSINAQRSPLVRPAWEGTEGSVMARCAHQRRAV
jgi:hypothetical protein